MDTKPITKIFPVIILTSVLAIFIIFFLVIPQLMKNKEKNNQLSINNFEECVVAGNPVMESYPRQCAIPGGQTFTEQINEKFPDEPFIGGDTDSHNCLIAAGYSWCAPKNKCLRIWEEQCYINLEQEIQYLLANKYEQPVNEIKVTIFRQVDNYVSGGVKFGADNQGAGGLFLATKLDNVWQLVYDGNGSVDCFKLRQEYGFPDKILKPNFCD